MRSAASRTCSQATLAQRRAGHRRGAGRHRDRPVRRDPRGGRLQPLHARHRPPRDALRDLHRGVLEHPAAAGADAMPDPMADAPQPRKRDQPDQRRAVHRRDAGAARHLHGHGAADHSRRDRAAERRQQAHARPCSRSRSRCATTRRSGCATSAASAPARARSRATSSIARVRAKQAAATRAARGDRGRQGARYEDVLDVLDRPAAQRREEGRPARAPARA